MSDIFEATALLDFAVARSAMTGLNLDRMGGSVASFDNLYLPRLHRAGYVAPNASSEHIASPGGFVLDSMPGIYDHVLVLDFKSLYPSIIRTFCIDPLGLALGVSGQLSAQQTVPGFLNGRFAREGHILPALIEQLWQQRDAAKAGGDAAVVPGNQNHYEQFLRGARHARAAVFSMRASPVPSPAAGTRSWAAPATTSRRRATASFTGTRTRCSCGFRRRARMQQAVAAGRQLERDLNAWWREVIRQEFDLESVLELQFETHFKRFLMPTVRGSDKGSKKRYAGVVAGKNGDQLVFKGLESVRTDWTRLAREFQEELYRRIFMQEAYAEYVQEVTARVLAGEEDQQLVYRKRLRRKLEDYQRNVPPHVQAARLCAERGLPVPVPRRLGGVCDYHQRRGTGGQAAGATGLPALRGSAAGASGGRHPGFCRQFLQRPDRQTDRPVLVATGAACASRQKIPDAARHSPQRAGGGHNWRRSCPPPGWRSGPPWGSPRRG